MTSQLLVSLVFATVALAFLMLAAGIMLGRLPFFQRALMGQTDAQAAADGLDHPIMAEVMACSAAVDQLHADLASLRSEMYWIAGEQVIEQAIQMCRDGLPIDQIGTDTGLTEETVRAIRLLRCH